MFHTYFGESFSLIIAVVGCIFLHSFSCANAFLALNTLSSFVVFRLGMHAIESIYVVLLISFWDKK